MNTTQTGKGILSNEEAVMLACRLRDIAVRTDWLAHVLYSAATPLFIDVLEVVIAQTNFMISNPMTEEEHRRHKYVIDTMKSLRGRGAIGETRLTVVQRTIGTTGRVHRTRTVRKGEPK